MGQNKILDSSNEPQSATLFGETQQTLNGLPLGKSGDEIVLKVTPIGGTTPVGVTDVNVESIGGNEIAVASGPATTGTQRVVLASDSPTVSALGNPTDTPSTAVEDATSRSMISLLKGVKNWLRDLAANLGVASGAADAGNPLKVGGRFNTTQPTVTDGQRVDLQTENRGTLKVALYSAATPAGMTNYQDSIAALSNGIVTITGNTGFNGSTIDRWRSNTAAVLLASSARTITQTSADLTNHNGRGLQVILDVTSAGTGSVTLSIQGKDANDVYYTLLTGAAVVTNSTNVYHLGPEITAVANQAVNLYVPRTFRIIITANNANSMTYSAAYNLNV